MPVPPLEDLSSRSRHHDGRCRTWTVDHIPDYTGLPTYEPGPRSPALVALDGWQITWDGTLSVFRTHEDGTERHPDLDQASFDTEEEADAAAWNAGVVGLMVYEDVAHLYGLPSSLAWVRSTPDIMTTDAGHDDRKVTDARTVEWCRILDPARDLTPGAWAPAGDNDLCATFVVSAYGANSPDRFATDDATVEFVEVEYGMVVSVTDDDDAEVFSHYVYETVAGATDASPEALDGYLAADMQATFQNLGGGDTMADCVWNATVEDTTLHLGANS
jgi:hypothetical protein